MLLLQITYLEKVLKKKTNLNAFIFLINGNEKEVEIFILGITILLYTKIIRLPITIHLL